MITPKEVDFSFRKIFNDGKIELLSYPLETILAEKIETIFSRGIGNTRPRDFYDVFILSKLKNKQIEYMILKTAFYNTRKKRQSGFEMKDYELVLQEIRENEFQRGLWSKYQRQYVYAKDITFDEVMEAIVNIMAKI